MAAEIPNVTVDDYINILERISKDVADDLEAIDGSDGEYIANLHEIYAKSPIYKGYDLKLSQIGGRVLTSRGLGHNPFVRMPIRDGFVFGLDINARLLIGTSPDDNPARWEAASNLVGGLEKQRHAIMWPIFRGNLTSDQLVNRLYSYGHMLSQHTVIDPHDPLSSTLNSARDPLTDIITELAVDLYVQDHLKDDDHEALYADKEQFHIGYALARASLNRYEWEVNQNLERLFLAPDSTLSQEKDPKTQ